MNRNEPKRFGVGSYIEDSNFRNNNNYRPAIKSQRSRNSSDNSNKDEPLGCLYLFTSICIGNRDKVNESAI